MIGYVTLGTNNYDKALAFYDTLLAELDRTNLRRLYDDCCAFLPARVSLELADYPDVFAY